MMAFLVSVHELQHLLQIVGYPAIALLVFIECIGIPIPGETMLLLASFYAATNDHLQIPFVIISAAIGAILGDNVGYHIGRTGGRALVQKYGRFFFVKMEHLDKAERFFQRHGAKTVFFGRFISLLRIWAAFLAGMNRMNWRTFMIYNGLGGIVWATYVGLLGFVAGRYFHQHFSQVSWVVKTLGWAGLAAVVLFAVVAFIVVKIRLSRRAHSNATSGRQQSKEPLSL